MFHHWIVIFTFFLPCQVLSFSILARLSIWPFRSNATDELGDQIEEFANSNNTDKFPEPFRTISVRSKINFYADSSCGKPLKGLDKKDKRTGFSINARTFNKYFSKEYGIPMLGDCMVFSKKENKIIDENRHRYKGEILKISLAKAKHRYSRKYDFSEKYEYSRIMGGVSVSVFGLLGASAEATVTTTVKKNKKSLLLYRHQRLHKGISSLANVQLGKNWETCTTIDKHYYLRDILIGMETYIFVSLHFESAEERKKMETEIKVKVLFFSITKKITEIKEKFDKDVTISVRSIKTYPIQEDVSKQFDSVDVALNYIKALENKVEINIQTIQNIKLEKLTDNINAHLTYFFMPCTIQTCSAALPFKPRKNTILFELLERHTEMKSVLQEVRTLIREEVEKGNPKTILFTKLRELEEDIDNRLKVVEKWSVEKSFAQNLANKLHIMYGPERAPHYYERELKRIEND